MQVRELPPHVPIAIDWSDLRLGLVVGLNSKYEKGRKDLVFLTAGDVARAAALIYLSTDRGSFKRFDLSDESSHLHPIPDSETGRSCFSVDNFQRYKEDDFRRRDAKSFGVLCDALAKDVGAFCSRHNQDVAPYDFKACMAMVAAVMAPGA